VNCSSSELLFEAYLDDTLPPRKRVGVRAHLRSCGRCAGLFEELRVVDALLAGPAEPELPANFTFATMAEVRSLPRPHVCAPPLAAYLVCYLVAAWLLIGAAFLVETAAMRVLGTTALALSRALLRSLGSAGVVLSRVLDTFGSLGTLATFAFMVCVALASALAVGIIVVRPRLTARLRS